LETFLFSLRPRPRRLDGRLFGRFGCVGSSLGPFGGCNNWPVCGSFALGSLKNLSGFLCPMILASARNRVEQRLDRPTRLALPPSSNSFWKFASAIICANCCALPPVPEPDIDGHVVAGFPVARIDLTHLFAKPNRLLFLAVLADRAMQQREDIPHALGHDARDQLHPHLRGENTCATAVATGSARRWRRCPALLGYAGSGFQLGIEVLQHRVDEPVMSGTTCQLSRRPSWCEPRRQGG
jgi:hypothetical protein